MYYEEEVQAEEPEFELLSDLKSFSPLNFECIEFAANEIDAEFLSSLDSDLDWIFHDNRLFGIERIDASGSTVRELYFHRRG